MKRILITLMMLMLFAGQTFALDGVITELFGTVELKAAGKTVYTPAKKGDAIKQDTVISTGLKSSALITVGSSTISVRPLTRLTLTEISSSVSETINMNLQTGRVKVDVKPPTDKISNVSVHSPVATASVRGTSFELDTHSLKVLEGTVLYQGSENQTVYIRAGFSSNIKDNGKASNQIETYLEELIPSQPLGIAKVDNAELRGGMSLNLNFPEYRGNLEFKFSWVDK